MIAVPPPAAAGPAAVPGYRASGPPRLLRHVATASHSGRPDLRRSYPSQGCQRPRRRCPRGLSLATGRP